MPAMEDRPHLVLASGSPRRRAILDRLGLRCRVVVPDVDESRLAEETVEAFVRRVARDKARAVAEHLARGEGSTPWVLGADTVVVVDGEPLGKPQGPEDARRMLASLSGRAHEVLTAFCVTRQGGGEATHVETTRVWFRRLEADEIDGYVACGEPLDKAGAYGIQGLGCFLVERIEGNYENVVGLPACPLVSVLRRLGALGSFPLPSPAEASGDDL
jgi:septum formation protein